MPILVIYKSKYGSTREYAEWLAEELGNAVVMSLEKVTEEILQQYTTIAIGSCTYLGKMPGADFMIKKWPILKQKKVYFFAVGMYPFLHLDTQRDFGLIPDDILDGLVGYNKLPGRVDESKLSFLDKQITKLATDGKTENKMDRKYLQPIVTSIKNSSSQ